MRQVGVPNALDKFLWRGLKFVQPESEILLHGHLTMHGDANKSDQLSFDVPLFGSFLAFVIEAARE